VTVLRTITIAFLIACFAISFRADQGPGGGGSGGGGDSSGGPGPSAGGTSRGTPGGPSGHDRREARSADGTYSINVSGFYKGTGTATVTATSVTITANVKSESGDTVTLQSEALTVSGPYFSGNGTVGDNKITIKGRLDAAKISRLVATFKTTDNHHGRIAGTLPTDTPVAAWDDDTGQH